MTRPDEATRRQIEASRPDRSTWLSANAGSGKTRVLTDRVARLLLRGTAPQNILCLTYTRAAASEMQNRLFARLGDWAMKPDADLARDLAALGEAGPFPAEALAAARRLFAQAIEVPGGLRIQTIHSFCGSVLRRFPLEAGLSPVFTELDENTMRQMWQDILRDMAGGEEAALMQATVRLVKAQGFLDLVSKICAERRAFGPDRPAPEDPGEAPLDGWLQVLFTAENRDLMRRVGTTLVAGDNTHAQKNGEALVALADGPADLEALDRLFATVLKLEGPATAPKKRNLLTKLHEKADPALAGNFAALVDKVFAVFGPFCIWQTARNSALLHNFARAFLTRYATAKMATGQVDFDDLIDRASQLFTDPRVADWVMFRLDGGIDHILVDESQDTSPDQWRIIRALTENFGQEGDDRRQRTLFVVGDKKQSIYSFQGADAQEFENMRLYFREKLENLGQSLHELTLEHSFRSSPVILDAVDAVITRIRDDGFAGTAHRAFDGALPGRVDLWPAIAPVAKPEALPWHDPTPVVAPVTHEVELARVIAENLRDMVAHAWRPDGKGGAKKVRAGDILILFQRRKALFHETIRALKRAGLPVAGADRLKLDDSLAVQDLQALLSFLSLPKDDLSLAALLRSPIFGLSEQALFALAHGRPAGRDLWAVLQNRDAPELAEARVVLADLLDRAEYLAPYDLLERALTRWGARARLIGRLGAEAADGIDALLDLAREYESTEPASLTGFLFWLGAREAELRRQAESAGDNIRVMTTHGAKGLEAEIVILPETQTIDSKVDLHLRRDADGRAFYPATKAYRTAAQEIADNAAKQAALSERMRLFYVAMTRAKCWLILCGAGNRTDHENAWFNHARQALDDIGAREVELPGGQALRFDGGNWPEGGKAEAGTIPPTPLPDWAYRPADRPARPVQPINPSALPGAKTLGPDVASIPADVARAGERGTALHLVLEHFGPGDFKPERARARLQSAGLDLPTEDLDTVLAQAAAIFARSEFAPLFATDALREVPLSAPAQGTTPPIEGTADRVIISDDRVLVVDFKSNAAIPDRAEAIPPGILAQMAAYVHVLGLIYPQKRVEAAVLWTAGPELMPIPHALIKDLSPYLSAS